MTRDGFEFVAALVKAKSGLVLTADKLYMLETRLSSLLKREGFATLDVLAQKLRMIGTDALAREVIEALTTNESSFFRDGKPFEHFRRHIQKNLKSKPAGTPFRIWSSACSMGQEAYSLAMILEEEKHCLGGRRVEIIGTDISREVLNRAREGLYTSFEVQRGLPVQQLVRHLRPEGGKWRITPELKSMCRFEERNLMEDFRSLGRFDIIFCRNVLIYFDGPTKSKILNSLCDVMSADALLYLGGAETVLGLSDKYTAVQGERGIYTANASKS
jgi:chemotaxis protein methyltransferase CheR